MRATDIICCVVFNVGLATSGAAVSAQIGYKFITFPGSEASVVTMKFSGPIVPEDVEKFRRVAAAGLRVKNQAMNIAVELDSPGGDVAAAMEIGRQIRANDMRTRVEFVCSSSCIFIFAAGVSRYASWDSRTTVGLHRPYYVDGEPVSARNADLKHKQMDAAMRAYFKEMNISDPLVDAMLRIPPENVRYLTREEMEQFGLVGEDPGYAARLATAAAKDHGLTMPEYYARVRRSDAECPESLRDMSEYFCKKAIMYGITVAEAKRRWDNTDFCGENEGLTSIERKRWNECISAVWRGERPIAAPTSAAAAAQKRKEALADLWAKVEAVHPGWREMVRTAEFQTWKASSPHYDKLASSENVKDAIALLDLYKARKKQTSAGPPARPPAKESPLPHVAQIQPVPNPCQANAQARPRSGVELGSRYRGGLGELRVANGMDVDAVAVLIDNETERPRRAIFIRSGESGAMKSVPAGRYRLRFQLGSDWLAERRFCRPRGASEFESAFDFDEVQSDKGIKYSVHKVTLHPVPEGTARTHVVMDQPFELPPP